MIVSAIILMFTTIVSFLMGLLPNMDILPSFFTDAWEWIAGFTANMVWTVPGGEDFLFIANTGVLLIGSIFLWRIVNWVINKIRGSGN